ncbi:MAG: hypothetical protein ACRC62_12365, partial [Microcoleus sp.]
VGGAIITTISGSGTGQVQFPDEMVKQWIWSENTTSVSSTTPGASSLTSNASMETAMLYIASEDANNYIYLTIDEPYTANTSGGTVNTSDSIYRRLLWRRDGSEIEIGTSTSIITTSGTVTTSSSVTATPQYSLIVANPGQFNLVGSTLYRVNLGSSDPVTGTYIVEIYSLPSMAMTTETVLAYPIPDYSPESLLYPPIASYHPG